MGGCVRVVIRAGISFVCVVMFKVVFVSVVFSNIVDVFCGNLLLVSCYDSVVGFVAHLFGVTFVVSIKIVLVVCLLVYLPVFLCLRCLLVNVGMIERYQ